MQRNHIFLRKSEYVKTKKKLAVSFTLPQKKMLAFLVGGVWFKICFLCVM